MAFEVLDPPPFTSLSPARRSLCALFALIGVGALTWACDTVLHTPVLDEAQQAQNVRHR